jgi:hypothetical protein
MIIKQWRDLPLPGMRVKQFSNQFSNNQPWSITVASINKVIIVGNLGRDPELRYMPSGDAVANIAVATTDKWKDKALGEHKEATEWHRLAFFGKLAEIAGQYLKKARRSISKVS